MFNHVVIRNVVRGAQLSVSIFVLQPWWLVECEQNTALPLPASELVKYLA